MYLLSGLSNVFFIVTIGVSIYWLIFYKGQGLAYVFIPQLFQENSFKSILIIESCNRHNKTIYFVFYCLFVCYINNENKYCFECE